jgi:hypothetical protein
MLLLLVVLLAAGCGPTAHGPGAVGADPPPPRPDSPVRRWEHYCVEPMGRLDEVLTRAGEAGWEMVGLAEDGPSFIVCFKRPRDAGGAPGNTAEPPRA